MPARTQEDEANAIIMGGGGASFAFEEIGDTVTGVILSIGTMQQTDFKTKKPLFWDEEKTRPRKQVKVALQTDLTDGEGIADPSDEQVEDDDGVRNVYLRFKSADAVKKAVRAAKASKLEVGGKLRLKFSGEEKPKERGGYPTKLYEARYKPPVESADEDALDAAGADAGDDDADAKPARSARRRARDDDDTDAKPARSARKAKATKADSDDDADDPGF